MPAPGFRVIVCVMEPPQVAFVTWGCWGTGQDLAHQMKCLSRRGWALLLGLSRLDCLDLSWDSKVMSWMCVFCGSLCCGVLKSGIQLGLVPNIKRRAQVMSETAFMWLYNILQLQWFSLLFCTRKVRLLLLLVLYLSDVGVLYLVFTCACIVSNQGAAKVLIFPVVQQFTEAFVQALQMPDGPTSDSGFKMEVLKVSHLGHSDVLENKLKWHISQYCSWHEQRSFLAPSTINSKITCSPVLKIPMMRSVSVCL